MKRKRIRIHSAAVAALLLIIIVGFTSVAGLHSSAKIATVDGSSKQLFRRDSDSQVVFERDTARNNFDELGQADPDDVLDDDIEAEELESHFDGGAMDGEDPNRDQLVISGGLEGGLSLENDEYGRPVVSVIDFGAVPDGSTLTTQSFNAAVKFLESHGGGVLIVPPGKYLVTTVYLASNIVLRLERDAMIIASDKENDWSVVSYRYFVTPSTSSMGHLNCSKLHNPLCVGTVGEKFERRFYGGPVIYCVECDNIRLEGEGVIDGQGSKWWKTRKDPRGYLVFLVNSTNVHIEGLTFQNSAAWNIVPKFCTNVTVDRVQIYNHYVQGHNTDGVNPYGTKNVRISNTVIVTGDDCIAVKSGPRPSCGIPSENIVVNNVTCVGSHGLTIGSEMNAGVRNVHFVNITIDGRNTPSSQGVRLKSQRGRGGFVENVLYENIRIHNVKIAIQATLNYRDVDPDLKPLPHFRNITIRNVYGTMVRRTFGSIDGLNDAPIEGIHLENIYLFGGDSKVTPLVCKDTNDATFSLVFPPPKITGSCRTAWGLFLADCLGLRWNGLPRWFGMHMFHWFW